MLIFRQFQSKLSMKLHNAPVNSKNIVLGIDYLQGCNKVKVELERNYGNVELEV